MLTLAMLALLVFIASASPNGNLAIKTAPGRKLAATNQFSEVVRSQCGVSMTLAPGAIPLPCPQGNLACCSAADTTCYMDVATHAAQMRTATPAQIATCTMGWACCT